MNTTKCDLILINSLFMKTTKARKLGLSIPMRRSRAKKMNSSIDKAKHFFVESGILGPTNFRDSHDLFRKTSTIHIDTDLKNQIRKTSMCLRSKVFIDKTTINRADDSLINLQSEISNIRDTLINGETKIIILRTEIGKLKQTLQAIMHAQMEARKYLDEISIKINNPNTRLCLFCRPNNNSVKESPSSIYRHKINNLNHNVLVEKN
ncbi:uncharacterized protein LOC108102356 isoform X2 [Drosophila eugracilis]|uniref:uncharacterized protein LOC108102356 isoform X2 n=1 Tax=Drosophila eugracilis TaxID=29029 RepID=UPI0007E65D0F|nr:uncharacterized protein LOC108102356 isoform X2 [Drosophila eugracilis]